MNLVQKDIKVSNFSTTLVKVNPQVLKGGGALLDLHVVLNPRSLGMGAALAKEEERLVSIEGHTREIFKNGELIS